MNQSTCHQFQKFPDQKVRQYLPDMLHQLFVDLVQEIVVPMEEQIEIKDDKKKTTLRKVFPGYVLIKMIHW